MEKKDFSRHSSSFNLTKGINIAPQIEEERPKIEQQMCVRTGVLCRDLLEPSSDFNSSQWISALNQYLEKYKRFQYSEISSFVFRLTDRDYGTVSTNIEACIQLCSPYSADSENPILKNLETTSPKSKERNSTSSQNVPKSNDKESLDIDPSLSQEIQKELSSPMMQLDNTALFLTLLKFKDHLNLAHRQKELFSANGSAIKNEIDHEINCASSEMTQQLTNQLVGLIAIFTALSFVVFGGINSLANIFTSLNNGVLSTLTVSLCWGFCMSNLLFIFLYFILNITNHGAKREYLKRKMNLVQRFPAVFFVNHILLFLLTVCGFLIFIKHIDVWMPRLTTIWTKQIWLFAILVLIVILFFIISCVLIRKYKQPLYNNSSSLDRKKN